MDKLKPCPFCGGEAHLQPFMGYWTVGCTDCFGAVVGKIETKEEAIKEWNKRPSPWHTGTPTEEGWYVCKLKNSNLYETNYFTGSNWTEESFEKWQKAEETE